MATQEPGSKFVLKYADNGQYHRLGRMGGYQTLETTDDVWSAQTFDGKENASGWKNNESHVRHVPMLLVEMSLGKGLIDHGLVPLQDPGWEDFDPRYDASQAQEAAEQYKEVYDSLKAKPNTDIDPAAFLVWHWVAAALVMVHSSCVPADDTPESWDIVTQDEKEAVKGQSLCCGLCGKPLENQ